MRQSGACLSHADVRKKTERAKHTRDAARATCERMAHALAGIHTRTRARVHLLLDSPNSLSQLACLATLGHTLRSGFRIYLNVLYREDSPTSTPGSPVAKSGRWRLPPTRPPEAAATVGLRVRGTSRASQKRRARRSGYICAFVAFVSVRPSSWPTPRRTCCPALHTRRPKSITESRR
jgi:hypothetical protein